MQFLLGLFIGCIVGVGVMCCMVTAKQADWTSDTAVTLYTRIDEQHDGAKYDPIS
jgi:hypothetical protein